MLLDHEQQDAGEQHRFGDAQHPPGEYAANLAELAVTFLHLAAGAHMAVGRVEVVLVVRFDQLLFAHLAYIGRFLGGGMLGKLQALVAAAAELPVAGAVAIPIPKAVGRLAGKAAGGDVRYNYGFTSAVNLTIGLVSIPIIYGTKRLFDKIDPGAEF